MSGSDGGERGNAQFSTAIALLRQATEILSGVSNPQNSDSSSPSSTPRTDARDTSQTDYNNSAVLTILGIYSVLMEAFRQLLPQKVLLSVAKPPNASYPTK